MASPASRVIFFGLDGASMELVGRMVDEGHMPNLARLRDRGGYRPVVGVFPTLTPPGWTAIHTGAWPGTHGVMDFNIRALGRPLDETVWGINTRLCRAEYIWNTVERAGKTPILVKQEMSWPPTVTRGVQVEGTGPGVSNHHQIAGYHLFVSGKLQRRALELQRDPETLDPSALQTVADVDPVQSRPAEGWRNLPTSSRPPLELVLTIKPLHRGRDDMARGKQGTPKPFHGLVVASGGEGYDRLLVCRDRDAAAPLATLGVGEWSAWLRESFEIDGVPVEGHVRWKLVALTPTADRVEVFVPQIWPIEGYTVPAEVAGEILEHAGPFLQNPARDALGVIDDDTYFELLDYHHSQLARTATHLATTRPWDLLLVETHASDYCNHFFLSLADAVSGAPEPVIERCYRGVVRTFASIDRLIGDLMGLMDDRTAMLVVSDHGGTPSQHRAVDVADVLAEAGLLAYRQGANGRREVDLGRSRAVPVGLVHVFVNLEGREPGGVVPRCDYAAVQEEIVDALLAYRDPATGKRAFALALTRADAEMVNLWGDLVSDVVYALKPEFDGAHGKQLPSARLGIGGQHGTFVVGGAGVRQVGLLPRQVRHVDIAPTIAYLLGIPMPRECEGRPVYEALEDPNWPITELARQTRRAG